MIKNKISGVYKITNKLTGDFYIGSSKNIKQRWYRHKCSSSWKRLPNSKLYKAMAEFGLDIFLFNIIEETDNLREREQYWIDQLKPSYNDYRANGIDIERQIETSRRCTKEWYKIHRDEELVYYKEWHQTHREELSAKNKAWRQAHRDELLAKKRADCNRLCFYEGETITLNALTSRFRHQGISHARIEAKKYLVEGEN